MRYNAHGYTKEYAQQCAAWTINNLGSWRKQCGLPVSHNVDGWIYLCSRHHRIIERAFEVEIDNLNSRRVENMQARLDAVAHLEEQERESHWDMQEYMDQYEQRRTAQTVYFMRCEQFVKIGMSFNPTNRLAQVRKGGGSLFPRRMDVASTVLIATEPGGFEREKELHAKFAHLRHTGEWFTETSELTSYIDSINNEADTDEGARLSHTHPNAARQMATN